MDPYIGTIILFAGNYTINGFAMCQGQILPIAQNTALFAVLGITYGGNGVQTFGLPDLRGRVPVGFGTGPGLPAISFGEVAGAPTVTLTTGNLPTHSHTVPLPASTLAGDASDPTGAVPANTGALDKEYKTGTGNVTQSTLTSGNAGSNQAFNIRNPYLGLNYLIALTGAFPSRA